MKNFSRFIPLILIVFLMLVFVLPADAQCPMCRMSAESNLKNGGTMGTSLNFGILYLLALPYSLAMVLGYLWYKNRKTNEEFDPRNN
ncbi:MAG TPA: hypothetical protein PLY70_18425 [Saprospiraceae bacterium]|nr:hypothetical protein [Saprospiraceae bacterium]HPN69679.1 hypothetical protein [Saprospiraceae bacterium]